MPDTQYTVTVEPHGARVRVPEGTRVLHAVAMAGVALEAPCGGQGTCGKCRVRMDGAGADPLAAEKAVLSQADLDAGLRLACQRTVAHDVVVDIPAESLAAAEGQILGAQAGEAPAASVPEADLPVRLATVRLERPTLEDPTGDGERVCRAVGAERVAYPVLRSLPTVLRAHDFHVDVMVSHGEVINVAPPGALAAPLVAAFDIGTTTIVGQLIEPRSGRIAGNAARMNPQIRFGDDVLSRVQHGMERPELLETMRRDVIGEVNSMVAEMAEAAGEAPESVAELAFSGNTTMQHLFAGMDPSALGMVPFAPATRNAQLIEARALGLEVHPLARAYVFPVIGGFVGGDTVAGILALALMDDPGPTLFIDIGTNGEIVLIADGQARAASCAAGPAFEGARIRHGMRAMRGAIESVALSEEGVHLGVVGGDDSRGICGSALVDCASELLRTGALMPEGLLCGADMAPEGVPKAVLDRVVPDEDGMAFLLAGGEGDGRTIALTQRDIRELQLATAAIRSATETLLQQAGVDAGNLSRLLVAGGFGNYLRLHHAQRIGLLPSGVPQDRFHFVGNTSLIGARVAACSLEARRRAESWVSAIQHVELSLDPHFQMAYVEAMVFPRS
jgi:uncharacterized 2Fe-2S/4Fe-4S cluster protein (DUF4445 family)